MNKEEKIFDTGFRVLEIFKFLLNENLQKIDLIKKLNFQDKSNNVFSYEAFTKYFNTLNFVGLKIEKEKNVYVLKNAMTNISLNEEEKKLFLDIIANVNALQNNKLEDIVKKSFLKLVKYINDEEIDENLLQNLYEKSKEKSSLSVNNNVISSLKSLISDESQIKIEFLTKNKVTKSIVVLIKEIREKNNNVFIKCYVPSIGRNKNICIDSIISISSLPTKKIQNSIKRAVIFEVYGRLASLYKLKPSEKVINFQNNCLTISNTEEDKDMLLRRLLKYGENCRIVSPADVKEEFLSMVDNIISKLEV